MISMCLINTEKIFYSKLAKLQGIDQSKRGLVILRGEIVFLLFANFISERKLRDEINDDRRVHKDHHQVRPL